MNQDLFHLGLMGGKTLKGGLRADNTIIYNPCTTKIGIKHIRIAFPHTFCMRIIKKPSQLG